MTLEHQPGALQDIVIEKQVIVGHLARRLAKQTESKSHHWEIFLYSPDGEDMTKWVEKVIFKLHTSFANPNRTVTREPYKAADDGWGEFEAVVEIYPKSAFPISLVHQLTFPTPGARRPALLVRREAKIVFRNPAPILYEGLTAAPFTWNKFKKIKNQPHGPDIEMVDEPSCDANWEQKWLGTVTTVSQSIRTEIQKLAELHQAKLDRIQLLLDEIRRCSPDIAEAASLFL
jgi:YEATS domain-containing protein 4